MKRLAGLSLLLLLTACGGREATRPPLAQEPAGDVPRQMSGDAPPASTVPPACVQVREHRDEDYTAGGLYAPGVRDSAPEHPLDVSNIPEPVPRHEPRSVYGNRSPYTVLGKTYRVLDSAEGYVERGIASWYGQKFHGRLTSSREPYDMCSFSAAHKTLPLPSYALVTNLDNGRRVVVRVNDRGPFHEGRIIDLSYAAAVRLGLDRTGTARVEVRALSPEGAAPLLAGGNTPATPATTPAAGDGGRRIVQVGAYSDKDNARRVARQLQDAGIRNVDVEDVRVDGRKFWRVRVGPLAAAAAEEVARTVVGLGLPSPRVFSE
ncbi:MAG TPA: septal ring lytic transglycosylase RlpA family protein [Arenimonas sp.]|jgi:rare lipoprotein A|nr:septal ring lytic transglycosylase RlpA family protein [Arenimonas sp.]